MVSSLLSGVSHFIKLLSSSAIREASGAIIPITCSILDKVSKIFCSLIDSKYGTPLASCLNSFSISNSEGFSYDSILLIAIS